MTEQQTVDLVEWLTKVWDEEERAAKACFSINVLADMLNGIQPPRWVRDGARIYDDRARGNGQPIVRVGHSWAREIDHIVTHDPASVLARIAADRAILDLHAQAWDTSKDERAEPYDHCATCWGGWPCPTLRLLASPYKGREGWQENWDHE